MASGWPNASAITFLVAKSDSWIIYTGHRSYGLLLSPYRIHRYSKQEENTFARRTTQNIHKHLHSQVRHLKRARQYPSPYLRIQKPAFSAARSSEVARVRGSVGRNQEAGLRNRAVGELARVRGGVGCNEKSRLGHGALDELARVGRGVRGDEEPGLRYSTANKVGGVRSGVCGDEETRLGHGAVSEVARVGRRVRGNEETRLGHGAVSEVACVRGGVRGNEETRLWYGAA